MFVCCDCCVLSGRGLCDGLITRPGESYRLWRVVVCDQETTKILVNEEEAKAPYGAVAPRDKNIIIIKLLFNYYFIIKLLINYYYYHHCHHHHHPCYPLYARYLQLRTSNKPCLYGIYSVAAVVYLQSALHVMLFIRYTVLQLLCIYSLCYM